MYRFIFILRQARRCPTRRLTQLFLQSPFENYAKYQRSRFQNFQLFNRSLKKTCFIGSNGPLSESNSIKIRTYKALRFIHSLFSHLTQTHYSPITTPSLSPPHHLTTQQHKIARKFYKKLLKFDNFLKYHLYLKP